MTDNADFRFPDDPELDITDRNDPPGLKTTPLDTTLARQVVRHVIESTAVHSKSKGWIPSVSIKLQHIPLVGEGDRVTTQIIMNFDDATEFVERLLDGIEAAERDVAYGLREL